MQAIASHCKVFPGKKRLFKSGGVGGIGGSLIGCLGALIGILASIGKARRFVLITTVILIVAGILLVIGGIVAVAMKQPYGVWYPMVLSGGHPYFCFGCKFVFHQTAL